MKTAKTLGKCAAAAVIMLALFCAALTAAFMIPDKKIEWHQEYSITVLAIEEEWESLGNVFGFHGEPGMLDNTTDRTMMQQTMARDVDGSALRTALYADGYTRYWHGYLTILRPLLVLFQIHQIRYLNVFVILGMFFAVMTLMRRRLGMAEAVGFLISMICAGIITVPLSMQFMASFVVMMAACIIVLLGYPFASRDGFILFFLMTGMIINFLDFLTVPLITLGVPLLVYMALDIRHGKGTLACGIVRGAQAALSWGAGYALSWMGKWVIAAAVLDMDVMGQVAFSAGRWTQAEQGKMNGRMDAVIVNFKDFFTFHGMRAMIVPLGFALVLAVCALLFRAGLKGKGTAACMLIACAAPYVWYFVMCHHSYEHNWFTYRAQVMTLFGAYLAMISLTDRDALKAASAKIADRWRKG